MQSIRKLATLVPLFSMLLIASLCAVNARASESKDEKKEDKKK